MCSIGDNWSFDDDVVGKYGCVVRAFDPRLVIAVFNVVEYMCFINDTPFSILVMCLVYSLPQAACVNN